MMDIDLEEEPPFDLVAHVMQCNLSQNVKALPDEPDPEDEVSLHKAKVLIIGFDCAKLPLPNKLSKYQDVLLAGKPPKSMQDEHKHRESQARAMDVAILKEHCGMLRNGIPYEACAAIIKRDGLNIEPKSLSEALSRDYKVSRQEALKTAKKRYGPFQLSPQEIKARILADKP